jgi:hypothetical protein
MGSWHSNDPQLERSRETYRVEVPRAFRAACLLAGELACFVHLLKDTSSRPEVPLDRFLPFTIMSCATACLPTHNHPHDPQGAFHTLGPSSFPNVETYVSLPPGLSSLEEAKTKKWNKIILWMADVYGPRYMNNQKVMDLTAAQGSCFRSFGIQLTERLPRRLA